MVKTNSVPISLYVNYPQIVSLLIFLLLLSGVLTSADDLHPPTFLTALSDQDMKVPLFWFSPHPETSEIAYHQDGMLNGFYVLLPWHESCVAVRMSSPLVPFHLLKSKIYISHQGVTGDNNYNFKAPFFVTINQDSGGIPQNSFLDSVSASASGEDSSSEGEWVDIEHNLLMEDSVFWIVFHWREDSPTSPLVGVDSLSNAGNSFCGKRTFFHFEWFESYHNIMIRAEITTNCDTTSEVDSFKVYGSTDSVGLVDPSNLIAQVPESQFQYSDGNVIEDQTYFYQVTSINSPTESPGSNQSQATPKRKAVLDANKEAFFICLSADDQILDNLTLTNSGGLPLWFKVQIRMEEAEWMGGSELFGYTWTDNSRQPGLEFTWTDIENQGIQIGESGNDNEDYGFFDLSFSFPFYGNTFDSLRIASDGWLSFSHLIPCYIDTFKCYINHILPWLWGPYCLVAPFWDDFKLTDSSAIYFYSNSDSAIISFLNIHRYTGGGPYTFQIILTPDGEITFQYLHVHDSLYSTTVGIQNQDGTMGLEVLCNETLLHDSLVIKIKPSWIKVDSTEGTILPEEDKTLNLTFDPLTYPKGIYHADLLIDGWDKNHQLETKVIPLTLCLDTTTSVEWADAGKPEKIALLQNYPNPFNPLTIIQYTVGSRQTPEKAVDGSQFMVHSPIPTTLKIYNLLGQLVRTLKDEEMIPGNYQVIWDGKDDKGKEVASGIYFCRLTAGSYQKIRKMVLLK
jgi:hypothetical protein